MKTTKAGKAGVWLAVLAAMLAAQDTLAASAHRWQANGTTMNHGFFFSNDIADVTFTDLSLHDFDFDPAAGLDSWSIDVASPATYVFSSGDPASTVAPLSGLMHLEIDYQAPVVTFEYAEVLFDGVNYSIEQTRTLTYDSTQPFWARWSSTAGLSALNTQFIDTYFGGAPATAVPLPNSVVLLASAAAFMGFTRRRSDAVAANA